MSVIIALAFNKQAADSDAQHYQQQQHEHNTLNAMLHSQNIRPNCGPPKTSQAPLGHWKFHAIDMATIPTDTIDRFTLHLEVDGRGITCD